MTFHQWLVAADAACVEICGLFRDDLCDWDWYDCWKNDQCPRDAVLDLLEYEGYAVG